jgi:hypothetical protein
MAGALILAGLRLSQIVNKRWILLSLLAGGYLLASGLTGWHPIERLFIRLKTRKHANDK